MEMIKDNHAQIRAHFKGDPSPVAGEGGGFFDFLDAERPNMGDIRHMKDVGLYPLGLFP